MTKMHRVKVRWSGFTGSPGYSNFFFREFVGPDPTVTDAQAAADRVRTFLDGVKSIFPGVVTLAVQNDVEVIEDTTGQLVDVHSITAPSPVTGTSTVGTYAAATGAVITWRSAGVRNGRRVRGRTFLVPIATNQYETNGTLTSGTITNIQNSANVLLAEPNSPDLGIWTRPSSQGASDGAWFRASSATVPDMAAILRSRRD